MARYRITYSNKKYKPTTVIAKSRLAAIDKVGGPSYVFFRVRKIPTKKTRRRKK